MRSHTFPVILSICSIWGLTACALFTEPATPTATGPQSRVYEGSFEEIWRAIQKALSKYPIQLNNVDQGVIETDVIKSAQAWQPPYKKDKTANPRYVIRVSVVKGRVHGKDSTRVNILKTISLEKDFFSGEVPLASDGLEEKMILYRVGREIQLEHSLKRAFERSTR